jgi:microcystin-dependent protein
VSDQFVAEIRIFPFNFPPTGWAMCNGQLMPISQNTFALPDLQGSAPMQPGQGQGLSLRDLGEQSGVEFVTLLESEMPLHSHNFAVLSDPADLFGPQNRTLARSRNGAVYQTALGTPAQMHFQMLSIAGASLPHNNMQPHLTLNFCIALQGIFPPRT